MMHKTPDYDNPDTGKDPSKWSEKTVADCPQRGRQPSLDLKPDHDDFYTKFTFNEKANASSCMEDYDDLPAIDNNEPVPQRTKWEEFEHGWRIEPNEALPSGASGASNSSKDK